MGKSLYPLPGYVTGEVGYRLRGGTFSNEWFYTLEAGMTYDRILIKGVRFRDPDVRQLRPGG